MAGKVRGISVQQIVTTLPLSLCAQGFRHEIRHMVMLISLHSCRVEGHCTPEHLVSVTISGLLSLSESFRHDASSDSLPYKLQQSIVYPKSLGSINILPPNKQNLSSKWQKTVDDPW
jgi:hypothetical protein